MQLLEQPKICFQLRKAAANKKGWGNPFAIWFFWKKVDEKTKKQTNFLKLSSTPRILLK